MSFIVVFIVLDYITYEGLRHIFPNSLSNINEDYITYEGLRHFIVNRFQCVINVFGLHYL